jgi:hypothetical protein
VTPELSDLSRGAQGGIWGGSGLGGSTRKFPVKRPQAGYPVQGNSRVTGLGLQGNL